VPLSTSYFLSSLLRALINPSKWAAMEGKQWCTGVNRMETREERRGQVAAWQVLGREQERERGGKGGY